MLSLIIMILVMLIVVKTPRKGNVMLRLIIIALIMLIVFMFSPIRAATTLPDATPELAISLLASVFVYQEKCLDGKTASDDVINGALLYVRAAGLDLSSPRTDARLKLEVARRLIEIETIYPSNKIFCSTMLKVLQ
jgi:hypothetical protein